MGGSVPAAEAVNLLGMTQLMNPEEVKYDDPDALIAAEDVFVKSGDASRAVAPLDPASILGDEVLGLANEIGIDLSEIIGSNAVKLDPEPAPLPAASAPAPADFDLEKMLGGSSAVAGADARRARSVQSSRSAHSASSSAWGSDADDSDDDADADASDDDSLAGAAPLAPPRVPPDRQRHVSGGHTSVLGLRPGGDLEALTQEEAHRAHISAVLNDMNGGKYIESFGLDHEQEEDLKLEKLNRIENLIMTLKDEDIEIDIPELTMDSPLTEIDKIMRRLQMRADRVRYSTFAEELVLGAADGIEELFNGERRLPLTNYRPDYRGYSGTVRAKLRRMRPETTQLVGDAMRKYNINPVVRILMELLPSFILYPRLNSGAQAAYSSKRMADAQGHIRDAQDPMRDRERLNAI